MTLPRPAKTLDLLGFDVVGRPLPIESHPGRRPDKSVDHDLCARRIFPDGNVRVARGIIITPVPARLAFLVLRTALAIPSLGTGLGAWDLVLRKLAHMAEYAVLAALLWRALGSYLGAFVVAVVYAGTDELHQHFVSGRHAAVRDVGIDAAGAAIGLAVIRYRRR